MLYGIVRYSRLHGPWMLCHEPPFYRKPPFRREPRDPGTPTRWSKDGIDGVIAYAVNRDQLRQSIRAGLPAVVVPIEDKVTGCCSIVEEENAVGGMAAEHFLNRGFTRFAFCGFDHMYCSRVRQEGFIRRLAEKGYTVRLYEPSDPPARAPSKAEDASLAEWLKSLPKPIGLLACNDDRAVQLFEANKLAGMRVPDQVAILGVDNDDLACELVNRPLSSIALNFEEVGYGAAAQLDRQMQGKKPSVMEISLRPTHTDKQAVIDGSAAGQAVTSSSCAPALNLASTYYWRVDEVNVAQTPSIWQGDVWSFSTKDLIVVDDFETYTNDSPYRLFQTWTDGLGFSSDEFFPQGNDGNGSGAMVGYNPMSGSIVDTKTVHTGGKAMPLTHDNTTATYSEATRAFASPQDWASHGVKAMVLYFYGAPTNVAQ